MRAGSETALADLRETSAGQRAAGVDAVRCSAQCCASTSRISRPISAAVLLPRGRSGPADAGHRTPARRRPRARCPGASRPRGAQPAPRRRAGRRCRRHAHVIRRLPSSTPPARGPCRRGSRGRGPTCPPAPRVHPGDGATPPGWCGTRSTPPSTYRTWPATTDLQTSPVIEGTARPAPCSSARAGSGGLRPCVLRPGAAQARSPGDPAVPFLADVAVIRAYRGFRPYCPDHLPIIGPDPRVPGLVRAATREPGSVWPR